jgi:hypothetical protein
MDNKRVEQPLSLQEAKWTDPVGGVIHVPDRLNNLFNKLGTQLRFHTISGKGEVETVADMTAIADDHASLQCASLREQIEELKTDKDIMLEAARKGIDNFQALVDQQNEQIEELKKEVEKWKGSARFENEQCIKKGDLLDKLQIEFGQEKQRLQSDNDRLREVLKYAHNKAYTLYHTKNGVAKNLKTDAAKLFHKLEEPFNQTHNPPERDENSSCVRF